MFSIGLMSGTSMDGIDCALLETDGSANLINELGHYSITYDSRFKTLLKACELAIRKNHGELTLASENLSTCLQEYLLTELNIPGDSIAETISALHDYLHFEMASSKSITIDAIIAHSTYLHAIAVEKLLDKTGFSAEQIDVVGYHGQAMYHQPDQNISIVVGDGQALADRLGIKVVNDFRSNDVAAGGQGAPFAPLYHQALAVRDKKMPLAVVNCGGIANITIINSPKPEELIAFDTGPGNALIDRLVTQRTNGQELMDFDGQYGINGDVNNAVIAALYDRCIVKNNQNYFSMPAPKALDVGDMQLIEELESLSLHDACATLEAFTADCIVSSLQTLDVSIPKYWVLAGGGWHNPVIRSELNNRLSAKIGEEVTLHTADEAGWNNQAMEAQIFAFLAVRSLQSEPLSLPCTTRVPYPLTGGKSFSPNILASE